MERITSKENDVIKNIRKLKEKKYRDLNNKYIIEGIKIIQEAINEKVKIEKIIICEDCENIETISKEIMYEIAKYECIYVNAQIFNSITDVKKPQGIIAIVEKENNEKDIDYTQDIILTLDDLQDPGNLGTIIRTADSVGLKQILVSNKTADVYNPKVVRATMGAIFRVKIIECEDIEKTLKEAKKHKYKTVITSLQAKKTIYEIEYKKKIIIIGNESKGIRESIQKEADEKIKIPMQGKTESLNASVATGIVLYEYVRQNKI